MASPTILYTSTISCTPGALSNIYTRTLYICTHTRSHSTHHQLKLARAAREGIEKQYASVHGAVKDMEAQLRSLMKGQPTEESVAWAKATEAEDEEEEEDIQWLTPKEERTRVQASFDYAKQLSEQVYCRLQTVAKATSLLPHHLKDGATQVYGYAQELYTTLKAVSPWDSI